MPTTVRLADGRTVTVETDDPEEAARAAHTFQQANPAPQAGRPQRSAAYERHARERAPQGRPGTFLRGLEDFNRSGPSEMLNQMVRNLGVADDLSYWANRHRGRDEAEAARDYELDRQQEVARDQPILNAASIAASIPATAGAAVRAPAMNMLQAGGTAMALNAPYALARQEGDTLQERLPGALRETAAVGAFSAGAQGLANRFLSAPRPNSASTRAAEFERAGVRPTMAAVSGGTPAGVTRMISENFVAGAPARARLQGSLDDTANAARNLAGRYGQHGQPEQVGETVQRAVQRFTSDRLAPRPPGAGRAAPESISTRDWSFRAKADALYDRVFTRIAQDEAQHVAGQTGVMATADATQAAIQQLQSRVSSPSIGELVIDPLIGRVANALDGAGEHLRFGDLRALRTWVREARTRPNLTQTIDDASLARLEQALTTDIYASAKEIGGETAAQQLRRVDQFYRAGQTRIQNALQAFDPSRTGGAQAYQRILSLAREGGRQNTRQLQQLRNSLQPGEWREVAATVIDDMGRPSAGHPQALEAGTFSVDRFVTNYAKLSEEGRRILFGGAGTQQLADALDNLARVAGYQKVVESMANRSRSGINVQNVGTGAGLLNPATTAGTATVLAGMAITGEMLTNPAFVRWMVSAARAGGGPGGMRRQLGALAALAARDPALAPLYNDLAQRVTGRSQSQESPQPERIAEYQ